MASVPLQKECMVWECGGMGRGWRTDLYGELWKYSDEQILYGECGWEGVEVW